MTEASYSTSSRGATQEHREEVRCPRRGLDRTTLGKIRGQTDGGNEYAGTSRMPAMLSQYVESEAMKRGSMSVKLRVAVYTR